MGDFTEAMKCHRQHWKLAKAEGDKVGQGKACAGIGRALLEKAKTALTSSPSDGEKAELLQTVQREVNLELQSAGGPSGKGHDGFNAAGGGKGRSSISLVVVNKFERNMIQIHPCARSGRGGIARRLRAGTSPRLVKRRSSGRGKRGGQQTKADKIVEYCKTAILHFRRHLSTSLACGDRADEGRAYGNLGSVYLLLEHFGEALEYHGKELEIAKELQNTHAQLEALINLGQTRVTMGDPSRGKEYLEEALGIAQDRQDESARAELHSMLGNCATKQGQLRQALRHHTLHLELAGTAKDVESEIEACANVGSTLLSMVLAIKPIAALGSEVEPTSGISFRQKELLKRAKSSFLRHLDLVREAGDQAGESRALAGLGETSRLLEEYTEAIRFCRECLHLQVRLFGFVRPKFVECFLPLSDIRSTICTPPSPHPPPHTHTHPIQSTGRNRRRAREGCYARTPGAFSPVPWTASRSRELSADAAGHCKGGWISRRRGVGHRADGQSLRTVVCGKGGRAEGRVRNFAWFNVICSFLLWMSAVRFRVSGRGARGGR